ncbi:MAG: hypothetical protein AABY55_00745 [Candidatus Omnitrophota bacterium]
MKTITNAALVVGAVSLIIGLVLRLAVKPIALGLVPSSFLEFSLACFLLTIALNTMSK